MHGQDKEKPFEGCSQRHASVESVGWGDGMLGIVSVPSADVSPEQLLCLIEQVNPGSGPDTLSRSKGDLLSFPVIQDAHEPHGWDKGHHCRDNSSEGCTAGPEVEYKVYLVENFKNPFSTDIRFIWRLMQPRSPTQS